jgi:hypothetical protein
MKRRYARQGTKKSPTPDLEMPAQGLVAALHLQGTPSLAAPRRLPACSGPRLVATSVFLLNTPHLLQYLREIHHSNSGVAFSDFHSASY